VTPVGVHDPDPGRSLDRLADRAHELDADAALAIRMTSTGAVAMFAADRHTSAFRTAVRLRARTGR
jgi:uncharacterized protein YbjQ (UPF0145 family)